jgi:hypothetical protein
VKLGLATAVKHFESFEALWKAKARSAFDERRAADGKPGFDAVHITH